LMSTWVTRFGRTRFAPILHVARIATLSDVKC